MVSKVHADIQLQAMLNIKPTLKGMRDDTCETELMIYSSQLRFLMTPCQHTHL